MSKDRIFHEAMDRLRASDDLYERVAQQARGDKPARRGHAKPLVAVVAGALTVAAITGGTVYAAGHVEVVKPLIETFFPSALGNHDTSNSITQDLEGGGTWTREYSTIDPSTLDPDLAQAVQPVNLSVEAFGTTLTVHDMVIDENACGMARFTLTNPDGIKLASYGMPNELILDGEKTPGGGDAPFSAGIGGMHDSTGDFLDSRCFYDSETVTDVSVSGTMYFTPIGDRFEEAKQRIFEGVSWTLSWYDDSIPGTDFAETERFAPSKAIKTRAFSNGGSATASLSPYGICYIPDSGNDSEFVEDRLVLTYTDGRTETLIDYESSDMVDNNYIRALIGKRSVSVFTKIINVNEVATISLVGRREDPQNPREMETLSIDLTPVEEGQS